MSQEVDLENLPPAPDALADAIRDGHVEENPENTEEVRITQAGIARYLILAPLAGAILAEDDPTGESPVEPPELDVEPDAPPVEEAIEVDDAPPPMEPPAV